MSTWPSTIGSRRSQRPPGERKSGRPLAVETPAPVSASTGAWRSRKRASTAASGSRGPRGYRSCGMTVALSLIAAVAWTMVNYWLVPLSRSVDPYVASLLMLVGNGLCTIPLALALDGFPGSGDLGPLGFALARRRARGRRLPVLLPRAAARRPRRGGARSSASRAASRRSRCSRSASASARSWRSASRSRCSAAASPPPPAGGARPPERCRQPAPRVCFGAMFALYAAAEDLGPVSVVARGPPQRARAARRARPLAARAACRPAPSTCACSGSAPSTPPPSSATPYAAARGPVSVAAVVAGQFSTLSAVVGHRAAARAPAAAPVRRHRARRDRDDAARACAVTRHNRAVANELCQTCPSGARSRHQTIGRPRSSLSTCQRLSTTASTRRAARSAGARLRGRSRPAGRRAGASSPGCQYWNERCPETGVGRPAAGP